MASRFCCRAPLRTDSPDTPSRPVRHWKSLADIKHTFSREKQPLHILNNESRENPHKLEPSDEIELYKIFAFASLPEDHPDALKFSGRKPCVDESIVRSPSFTNKLRRQLSRKSLLSKKTGAKSSRVEKHTTSAMDWNGSVLSEQRTNHPEPRAEQSTGLGGYDADALSINISDSKIGLLSPDYLALDGAGTASIVQSDELNITPRNQPSQPSRSSQLNVCLARRSVSAPDPLSASTKVSHLRHSRSTSSLEQGVKSLLEVLPVRQPEPDFFGSHGSWRLSSLGQSMPLLLPTSNLAEAQEQQTPSATARCTLSRPPGPIRLRSVNNNAHTLTIPFPGNHNSALSLPKEPSLAELQAAELNLNQNYQKGLAWAAGSGIEILSLTQAEMGHFYHLSTQGIVEMYQTLVPRQASALDLQYTIPYDEASERKQDVTKTSQMELFGAQVNSTNENNATLLRSNSKRFNAAAESTTNIPVFNMPFETSASSTSVRAPVTVEELDPLDTIGTLFNEAVWYGKEAEYTLHAGREDDVAAWDFAYAAELNLRGEPDSSHTNTPSKPSRHARLLNQKRRPWMIKSRSMTFGSVVRYYSNLFTSSTAQNRRSSVAIGGRLEHPELEVIPAIFPAHLPDVDTSAHKSSTAHLATLAGHIKAEIKEESHHLVEEGQLLKKETQAALAHFPIHHHRHDQAHKISSADSKSSGASGVSEDGDRSGTVDDATTLSQHSRVVKEQPLSLDGATDNILIESDRSPTARRLSRMYQTYVQLPTSFDANAVDENGDGDDEQRCVTPKVFHTAALDALEGRTNDEPGRFLAVPTPKSWRQSPSPKIRRFPSVTVVDDCKGHWRSVSLISVQSGMSDKSLRNSTKNLLDLLRETENMEREKLLRSAEEYGKEIGVAV
ncbi:hypothetical protein MBLNU459_g5652t1 [Dothideomycetes sp. NU459]